LSATGYDQPEDLRDADTAMYHAKALGKARYGVFDTAMHANTKALCSWRRTCGGLLSARSRIYYQPIVSLQSNRISGFKRLCAGSIHSLVFQKSSLQWRKKLD